MGTEDEKVSPALEIEREKTRQVRYKVMMRVRFALLAFVLMGIAMVFIFHKGDAGLIRTLTGMVMGIGLIGFVMTI